MGNIVNKLTVVFPIATVAFILLIFSQYLPLMDRPLTVPPEGALSVKSLAGDAI